MARTAFEAIANADAGPPLGRELEIADLLRFIRQRAHPQRRLGDRRRALRGGASLRSAARAIQGLRSVLGIRRRPAARGHLRTERARRHLRPRGPFRERQTRRLRQTARRATARSFSVSRGSRRRTKVMTVELRNLAGETIYSVDLEPARCSSKRIGESERNLFQRSEFLLNLLVSCSCLLFDKQHLPIRRQRPLAVRDDALRVRR